MSQVKTDPSLLLTERHNFPDGWTAIDEIGPFCPNNEDVKSIRYKQIYDIS